MKKLKFALVALLMTFTNLIFAADELTVSNTIDANGTRQATGFFDAVIIVPLITLFVFLVMMVFAQTKIPGLKD